jgi:16S rRNA (guanine(966)-N(2))-methyltransferase RsmD
LRIIGGEHKGRIIHVGRDFDARPTTDFAREALFNILGNHFNMTIVRLLDLFAGSGSISFESYSRGCREIDLVEINSRFVHNIRKEAAHMNMTGLHPVAMDVFRFLHLCKKQYDLVFADPPYEMKNVADLPGAVLEKDLLLPGGWFILEHSRRHNFNQASGIFDERKYGNVCFSFFRKGSE